MVGLWSLIRRRLTRRAVAEELARMPVRDLVRVLDEYLFLREGLAAALLRTSSRPANLRLFYDLCKELQIGVEVISGLTLEECETITRWREADRAKHAAIQWE